MSTIRVPTTTAGSRHHATIRNTLTIIHRQLRRSAKNGRRINGTSLSAIASDQHNDDAPTRPARLPANFFSLAPGPHGHPSAAAAPGAPAWPQALLHPFDLFAFLQRLRARARVQQRHRGRALENSPA